MRENCKKVLSHFSPTMVCVVVFDNWLTEIPFTKKSLLNISKLFFVGVRLIGLEPTRLSTPDPKSGASTNFATGAGVFFRRLPLFIKAVQR